MGHSSQVGPGAENSNKWEISGMPIQKSYVDKFFEACKNEKFCDFSSNETCGNSTTTQAPKVSGDSTTTQAPVSAVTTRALITLPIALCLTWYFL